MKRFELLAEELSPQISIRRWPLQLFLLICLNLAIAPAVQASTGTEISRLQAYALGLLGLVTLSLATYLFTVIFQPEKF